MKHLLRSTSLAVLLATSAAYAGEVDTIAILTPEQGTDFGWNQQGVDAAKAAGEKTGVEVIVAEGPGLRRCAPDRCASWPPTAPT